MLARTHSTNRFGLLALVVSNGVAGCSHDGGSVNESQPVPDVQFAVSTTNLPRCTRSVDGEVWYVWSSSQFVVCKGPTSAWTQTNISGYNAAVLVSPLVAADGGASCPAGGVRIQFGLDANRNGKLDQTEVTSSANLCNGTTGATGAQGPQGDAGLQGATGPQGPEGVAGPQGNAGPQGLTGTAHNSLVLLTPEAAGSNCTNGGVQIQTGLDLNDDNTLADAEVTQTQYVCNGAVASNPEADAGKPVTGSDMCAGLIPPTAAGNMNIANGYVIDGALQGYVGIWLWAESNSATCVTPACDSSGCRKFSGTALCETGIVTADPNWLSGISMGFNVNTPQLGTPQNSITIPNSITFTVDLSGGGAGNLALRPALYDRATDRTYCVPEGSWTNAQPIPITSFNTECWGPTSAAIYASPTTPITNVELQVPSSDTIDRPFAFCITDVTVQ